jgi:hypothetical protein
MPGSIPQLEMTALDAFPVREAVSKRPTQSSVRYPILSRDGNGAVLELPPSRRFRIGQSSRLLTSKLAVRPDSPWPRYFVRAPNFFLDCDSFK